MSDTSASASWEKATKAVIELISRFTEDMKPYEALRVVRTVKSAVQSESDKLSAAIIASVNGVPGNYDHFVISDISGRASVNTKKLHDEFYDAYDAVVTWGDPYKIVTLPSLSKPKESRKKPSTPP